MAFYIHRSVISNDLFSICLRLKSPAQYLSAKLESLFRNLQEHVDVTDEARFATDWP